MNEYELEEAEHRVLHIKMSLVFREHAIAVLQSVQRRKQMDLEEHNKFVRWAVMIGQGILPKEIEISNDEQFKP